MEHNLLLKARDNTWWPRSVCQIQESTKLRGLRGNVGYVGPWVAWVAWVNFLRWLSGYVGQDIFYVGCVGQIWFCVGPKFFAWVFAWVQNFCVSQLLFTRSDYFTILQLIVQTIISRVSLQQILIRLCLTSSLFLSSVGRKVDLGPLQRFRWCSL